MTTDLLEKIRNTRFLKQGTKDEYVRRINDFCDYLGKDLSYCILKPKWFVKQVMSYIEKHDYGIHTADKICSVFLAVFNYNQDFKEENKNVFDEWIKESKKIKTIIDEKYERNAPTERQVGSYVNFEDIISKRDLLKTGSQERLLVFMYTEIPPVRNDYHNLRIYKSKPKYNTGNFLVIGTWRIFLNDYKTDKTYETIEIDIPPVLQKEISHSLEALPRDYLFVSSRTNKPYLSANSFVQWANRSLKAIFNNNMSLTTLRHVYISRRDLALETKSGTERKNIARIMGHSLEQQQRYLWHSWLKENK